MDSDAILFIACMITLLFVAIEFVLLLLYIVQSKQCNGTTNPYCYLDWDCIDRATGEDKYYYPLTTKDLKKMYGNRLDNFTVNLNTTQSTGQNTTILKYWPNGCPCVCPILYYNDIVDLNSNEDPNHKPTGDTEIVPAELFVSDSRFNLNPALGFDATPILPSTGVPGCQYAGGPCPADSGSPQYNICDTLRYAQYTDGNYGNVSWVNRGAADLWYINDPETNPEGSLTYPDDPDGTLYGKFNYVPIYFASTVYGITDSATRNYVMSLSTTKQKNDN